MADIRAVVFDMDGVLIDSRELIYRAMEDVLLENEINTVTREDMAQVTGKPIHAMYRLLAPHLDAYKLERAHLDHHDKNMHLLKEHPGVHDVLQHIKRKNIKRGIFTGFNELTYSRLDQFNLTELFDTIVETTQYKQHKPHPEGLLMCMQKLEVTPSQTVYVGDGVSDILAGKAAKVHMTIGITQGFGSHEALHAAGADLVINDLKDLLSVIDS